MPRRSQDYLMIKKITPGVAAWNERLGGAGRRAQQGAAFAAAWPSRLGSSCAEVEPSVASDRSLRSHRGGAMGHGMPRGEIHGVNFSEATSNQPAINQQSSVIINNNAAITEMK